MQEKDSLNTVAMQAAAPIVPTIDLTVSTLQDGGIVIRDPGEIRPARRIPQKEIDEINVSHVSLAQAVLRTVLQIGFKLRCWHDLIPHGRWMEWCNQEPPNISERSVRVYLRLWDHNDLILARLKTADAADLTELPSIREALTWIPSKQSPPVKEKRAFRRRQVDIEVTVDCRPVGSFSGLSAGSPREDGS
jgi:hypothetical protein